MPKIRGVRPEYWTDEDIVELSLPARLLFIGLWNFACDNGHLADKPKQIKMRILPADEVDVDSLLDELAWQNRIERKAGTITIRKFAHHQKPHKRWWVTCDLPLCTAPGDTPQPDNNGGPTVGPQGDNGGPTADVDGEGDGELMVIGDAAEAAPTPAAPAEPDDRPDVEAICTHLAEQIEARGSKRPLITTRWRREARLFLDRDGRTEEQVHACIRWLFTSTHRDAQFWRTNIRSMPKLREEYDRLRELAERPTTPSSRKGNDIDWDVATDRARQIDQTGGLL